MRTMRFINRLGTLFVVSLFVVSFAIAGSYAAVPTFSTTSMDSTSKTPVDVSLPAEEGTNVDWYTDTGSHNDTWTWQNNQWLFGPRATYELYFFNGSPIERDDFIPVNEEVTLTVRVPEDMLRGEDLQSVYVSGSLIDNDGDFYGSFNMDYYAGPPESWWAGSNAENYTSGYSLPPYLTLNEPACNAYSDGTMHYVVFKITFLPSTPKGLYNFYVSVHDTVGNYYDIYSPWSSDMGCDEYAIGITKLKAQSISYDGSYTLEKFDLNGDDIYSITRNKDFTIRLNISGNGDLDFALFNLYSMDCFELPVNTTGLHWDTITKTGGWVFDPDIQTYVYNDSIQYFTYGEVFGDYYYYESVCGYESRNYTYRFAYFDDYLGTWAVNYSEPCPMDMEMYYLYNFTGGMWETFYGFYYYQYPSDTYIGEVDPELVLYSEPIESAPFNFYELNMSRCQVYPTDGTISVEFTGHITEDAPRGSSFRICEQVYDKGGWPYGVSAGEEDKYSMTWQEYNQAAEIIVESPTIVATLKKADDSPVYGWFFPAEQEEAFRLEATLYGGADIASDIDGAILKLDSYTSFWSEDEWGYSNLYYDIVVENDGTTSFSAYNVTAKENWTYGVHMEQQYIPVTDWHWEYNETLGRDIFVYSEYMDYRDVEVEGYYWQWWYFNQATGEWVTDHEWHSMHHTCSERTEATRVHYDFASVSDVSLFVSESDFSFEFLVNFTSAVPDANFWWDFSFANYSWIEDETSSFGYHEVAEWTPQWIYSFDYLGTAVHTQVSSEIAVINQTIPGVTDWLVVREDPYITINGVDEPILVRSLIGSDEDRLLFYGDYDPELDMSTYYYELLNGTRVYIYPERAVWIYNVTVPGYGSFLSTQKDYKYWYDGDMSYYGWWDINGDIHQGNDWDMWVNNVSLTLVHISDYNESSIYVRVGTDSRLEIQDYPRNDPRTGTMYLIDMSDIRYDIKVIEDCDHIFYEGEWQRISYSERSYEASYMGGPVFVPDECTIQEQWFTVDSHYEMPYPGANADYCGVAYTSSDSCGKVETTKTVIISGKSYILGGNPDTGGWNEFDSDNHTGFWVWVGGQNYSLDGRRMYLAVANGTYIWNPIREDATFDYGDLDGLDIVNRNTLVVDDTWFVHYYYNSTFGFEYDWSVTLANGTAFSCEPRYLIEVFLVDVEGTLVYTTNSWVEEDQIGQDWVYYIQDLSGTRHYFSDYTYGQAPVLDAQIIVGWEERTGANTTFHYIVNGSEYIQDWTYGWYYFVFTNGSLDGKYFDRYEGTDYSGSYLYKFVYKGLPVNATAKYDFIYEVGYKEGYDLVYSLTPIEAVAMKNFEEIIVGSPWWSMWGLRSWTVVPETGALDLDGDLATTADQYYVLEEYESTDSYSSEWSRMWVDLFWDPNETIFGDEMYTHSWMGVESYSWSSQWQQTYYWYHAADMTLVSSTEMAAINATIVNPDGTPTPGYWDLSHMVNNVTWEDILAEALANGWDWVSQDEQTWTWLSFGFGQDYGVDTEFGYDSINLRYEFSGLMLWEDANNNSIMDAYSVMDTAMENPGDSELTHYFIPDRVDSVSFVTPGIAYGVPAASGHLLLGVEDEVAWGVTFHDVNGTTFPFNAYGYWDWYDGVVTGSDLRTFDERPTRVTIDEISFLVHFQGVINTTAGATSNYATIKVDNTVGRWDVNMIGGIANLEGKSLALNYLADVSTSQFRTTEMGVGQEDTIVSDSFEIGDAGTRFAEMIIGGVTYEWAADPYNAYNVTSQTTPFSTFTSAYESDNGQSATSWSFTSTQYYVSIGFPYWDGYFVYQDPIFVGYVSNTGDTGGVTFNSLGFSPAVPSSTDAVTVSVDFTTDYVIDSVELVYSTDGYNFDNRVEMWFDYPGHYSGEIPAHPEETQIWYRVIVNTQSGTYESDIESYIVGQGVVTSPTLPTTTPRPTGPIDPIELSAEMLIMLGGIALAVVVLGVAAKRRK